jgi:hypothetical protein
MKLTEITSLLLYITRYKMVDLYEISIRGYSDIPTLERSVRFQRKPRETIH